MIAGTQHKNRSSATGLRSLRDIAHSLEEQMPNEALRAYRARLSSLGPLAEAAGDNGSDCPACGGIGYVRNDARPGEPGFGALAPCECKREEIARKRTARLEAISGLSEQEQRLTLEQVDSASWSFW